jgi:hypothetical protein
MQVAASSYNPAVNKLEWQKTDGGMKVSGLIGKAAV